MVKVSIVVPVYNVEPYIADCLQSVMRQTYQGPLECIVVDDCGTDKSIEIAEQAIEDYDGPISFRLIHHEHNRGLSAARNTGTDAASGDYVYYLDSDDAISPDRIELLTRVVESHPEVEVVQGAMESIPYRKYYDLQLYKTPCYVENKDWVRYNAFKYGERLPVNAFNKLLKKSFLVENGLAFKEGIIHEDELWSFLLYQKVKYWAVIEDKTYLHYHRPNSIMDALTNQRRASNMGVVLKEALKSIDNPLGDLQVYKCFDSFVHYVLPYATDRSMVRRLYLQFLVSLKRIGKVKMAFRFVTASFNKSKRKRLFYVIMPQEYKEASNWVNKCVTNDIAVHNCHIA